MNPSLEVTKVVSSVWPKPCDYANGAAKNSFRLRRALRIRSAGHSVHEYPGVFDGQRRMHESDRLRRSARSELIETMRSFAATGCGAVSAPGRAAAAADWFQEVDLAMQAQFSIAKR
jgi:hypothetical protein